MTDRRRYGAVLLAALLAVLLGGCSMLADQQELSKRLAADSYADAAVSISSKNGYDTVEVTTAAHPFDALRVKVGVEVGRLDHAGLVSRFGPRDPALDRRSVGDELGGTFATAALIALVVVLVVVLLAVVLAVVLVRRSRRRRAAGPPWPPGPPYGGPPPGAQPWQPRPPTGPPPN